MRSAPSRSLTLSSPAKLNLFLDCLYKRPDGYHELETLFERISLEDTLRLTVLCSDEIVIASKSPDIPLDKENLAYRAAHLIKQSRGVKKGVKIEIEKNIPVGAGLGGGSSNAASVLLGMNKLFDLRLKRKTLISYANRLGSDVAFFVLNKSFAIGRGRGGELTPVSVPRKVKIWHILFFPPIKVLTRDVYGLLDKEEKGAKKGKILRLTKEGHDVNILIPLLRRNDIFSLNRNIYNRLSENVMKSYSSVSQLKTALLKFGLKSVHMSGSGPTLFSVFKTQGEAQRALDKLQRRFSDRCTFSLASTR